jgi:Rrf2 family protein
MPLYGAGTEYALHTLLNVALAPATAAPSARELAEFQKLPVAFIRRLLTRLEKAGLILGAEGIFGGWRLARDPAQISVLEIVEAANGRNTLFECREIRDRSALWPDDHPPRPAVSGVC